MKKRYERNVTTFSEKENEDFKNMKVCVVGCGGLGGYIIEFLGRVGIGHITAIDGDVFEESNLNRQILSTEKNMGRSKAAEAKERMSKVNSDVTVLAIEKFLKEENAKELVIGHDLVFDALDNITSRKILQEACKVTEIPMVHGAIAGWYGQLTVVYPGDDTLSKIYPDDAHKGIETELGNPAFTPAAIAAMEVAEGMKVLLERGEVLKGRLLTIDLLTHEYEIMEV